MALIEVRGIAKSFSTPAGTREVLRDVSFDVEQGEFVSIVGPMGSGKSTLLAVLAGLIPADRGTIAVGGERQRGIRDDSAVVFQNYSLLPWFSAFENVRLAVQAAAPALDRDAQRQRARAALEQVGLGNAVHKRPRQLSGGMRQRVALARALVTRPRLLFLDDPFGALDALTRETLQQELATLCGGPPADASAGADAAIQRTTIVMITNHVEEAILLSDRIIPIVPGPPATLGPAVSVDLARPRSVNRLAHDEDATQVRSQVVAALTASMHSNRARASRRTLASAQQPNAIEEAPPCQVAP